MGDQEIIFEKFRKNVQGKLVPYLLGLNFLMDGSIDAGLQVIGVKFKKGETVLTLSVSLHHLDHGRGIGVTLKSKFGGKDLRNEVEKYSSKKVSAYSYNIDIMDVEFERILKDLKTYFEKYMVE